MEEIFKRGPLLLLAGRANKPLCQEIGEELGIPTAGVTVKNFADGEIFVRIDRNVRGRDVFIVQPTSRAGRSSHGALAPDRCRQTGVGGTHVTAVVSRTTDMGDRTVRTSPASRSGPSLCANLITAAGADRLVGIDFHQHQIQGFFDIPVDHLYAAPVLVDYFRDLSLEDLVVVAPDVGKRQDGERVREPAGRRVGDRGQEAAGAQRVGGAQHCRRGGGPPVSSRGRHDRHRRHARVGGVGTQEAWRDQGLRLRHARALLSGSAKKKLTEVPLEEVVVTNTIDVAPERRFPKRSRSCRWGTSCPAPSTTSTRTNPSASSSNRLRRTTEH